MKDNVIMWFVLVRNFKISMQRSLVSVKLEIRSSNLCRVYAKLPGTKQCVYKRNVGIIIVHCLGSGADCGKALREYSRFALVTCSQARLPPLFGMEAKRAAQK